MQSFIEDDEHMSVDETFHGTQDSPIATNTNDPFSPAPHTFNKKQNNFNLSMNKMKSLNINERTNCDAILVNLNDNQENFNCNSSFEAFNPTFNSIFSNETDFLQFLEMIEKKETSSTQNNARIAEFARQSLYLQFDPVFQKMSSHLSPEKMKRLSLIRDKQEAIKSYLSEIKEEECSFTTISTSHNERVSVSRTTSAPVSNSKQNGVANASPVSSLSGSSTTTNKTPKEEALAFLEKTKNQIKKQTSLNINESIDLQSQQHSQEQHESSSFHLDERFANAVANIKDEQQHESSINQRKSHGLNRTPNRTTIKPVAKRLITTNEEIETNNDANNPLKSNDNNDYSIDLNTSAQIIDVNKYRIDFTSDLNDYDDDDDEDYAVPLRATSTNIKSKKNPNNNNNNEDANNDDNEYYVDAIDNFGSSTVFDKFIKNHQTNDSDFAKNNTGDNKAVNNVNQHLIDEINTLKENEKHLLENIRCLQDENEKFKTIAIEFERIFQNLIKDKEETESKLKSEIIELTKERDHLQEDVIGVEKAFDDLHRRFEKLKIKVEEFKKNEEQFQKNNETLKQQIEKEKQKYATLKKHAEEKLELANNEIEKLRRSSAAELQALKAELRKAEIKISSLELNLQQKDSENTQLTNLLEDLLSKVKPT